jgi:uncharacterized membrane protein HdeD (DUF308 family)
MKAIRYLAACLLLLTGVLHVIPIIKTPSDPNAVPMLVFGIVYFAIGVLLFLKVKYADLLGIIFPIIGLATGFFMVGVKNWTAMLTFLFAIDALVLICCILLLLNKKKN